MIKTSRTVLWLALIFAALLRLPSLPVSLWNIDEANMAAAADILVSGGVYYKDVVDHRGPVTPYVYAAVFLFSDATTCRLSGSFCSWWWSEARSWCGW